MVSLFWKKFNDRFKNLLASFEDEGLIFYIGGDFSDHTRCGLPKKNERLLYYKRIQLFVKKKKPFLLILSRSGVIGQDHRPYDVYMKETITLDVSAAATSALGTLR